jgi:hypothetical protein
MLRRTLTRVARQFLLSQAKHEIAFRAGALRRPRVCVLQGLFRILHSSPRMQISNGLKEWDNSAWHARSQSTLRCCLVAVFPRRGTSAKYWSDFQGMVKKCNTLAGADKKECIANARDK